MQMYDVMFSCDDAEVLLDLLARFGELLEGLEVNSDVSVVKRDEDHPTRKAK
jgi:hypothetical protein